jgi:hypothetical protein
MNNILITYLDVLGIKQYTGEEYRNILMTFYFQVKNNKDLKL